MLRCVVVLFLVAFTGPLAAFERTSSYTALDVSGWTVLVSSGWSGDLAARDAALGELARQLDHVETVLPPDAVAELRQVRIWLENAPLHPSAGQFHLSGFWLRDNGYNPSKVGAVELNRQFYAWRRDQPMLVLHELAHAWHHRALRDQSARIDAAFAAARASGVYGNAYAMTDPKEYFAELTEALFGQNDQTPLDRTDLARIDPAGLALVADLWGVAVPDPPALATQEQTAAVEDLGAAPASSPAVSEEIGACPEFLPDGWLTRLATLLTSCRS